MQKALALLSLLFLVTACGPKELDALTRDLNEIMDQLDQMSAEINAALMVNNMDAVKAAVPQYAAKAEKFDQLSEQYRSLVLGDDDPEVAANLKTIDRAQKTLLNNIDVMIKALEKHDDLKKEVGAIKLLF